MSCRPRISMFMQATQKSAASTCPNFSLRKLRDQMNLLDGNPFVLFLLGCLVVTWPGQQECGSKSMSTNVL